MAIRLQCERCRREVQAPDSAGGKRGKCPYCGHSNYIPIGAGDEAPLPLMPIDGREELARRAEIEALRSQERELLAESGPDARGLVVDYCLDMAASELDRCQMHVEELKRLRRRGVKAVEDFLTQKAMEPALGAIPEATLQGFLKQLRAELTKTKSAGATTNPARDQLP